MVVVVAEEEEEEGAGGVGKIGLQAHLCIRRGMCDVTRYQDD